ncbi:MAG: phosphate--AMP phosphotransferase, partial [Christensenellaceae bacterium]
IAQALRERIAQDGAEKPVIESPIINQKFQLNPQQKIEDCNLAATIEEQEYLEKLKELQKKLGELHNVLYKKKIPMIIGYEGNDAAGKGGNIKRVARALDPRGYAVTPIAAPSTLELNHQYLWRFWNALPRTGHIEIFDRTWYGRVLVERVENLTPHNRIMQAYNEINEFEYMLHKWGAIVLKYWIAIDKEEQLKRFELRQNTPEKQWKITDEDWRNRDKW